MTHSGTDLDRLHAPSVGVFSIATNRYADYWMSLARTADEFLFPDHEVVLTVFTDRVDEISRFSRQLTRVEVQPIKVHHLGWPEATLAKFRTLATHGNSLDQDILMHLDADMRIHPAAKWDLDQRNWSNGIALVQHPGFRRPSGAARSKLCVRHPSFIARDLYRQVREGGRGTWERDRRSKAFVAVAKRRTYVCGGTWMGQRDSLLQLCEELSERVLSDSQAGVIARFHDESHLNWFSAYRSCTVLDSDYCFVDGAANLKDLIPRISAVEKYDERTR